jgi:hypothetical protein
MQSAKLAGQQALKAGSGATIRIARTKLKKYIAQNAHRAAVAE